MKKAFLFLGLSVLLFSNSAEAQNLPSYLPSNGLVGWWPFNGNADDESGNGNNGTVNGATLTTDRIGNQNSCYQFNAMNNNSIDVGVISLSGDFSLACWFYLNSNGSWHSMISKYGQNGGYALLCGAGGELYAHTNEGTAVGNVCTSNLLVVPGAWRYVVLTLNAGVLSFYFEGNLIYSCSNMNNSNSNGSKTYFGRQSFGLNENWDGKLDDIAIYNRALTQEEITALYTGTPVNGGGGNTSANPVPPGIPYQAVVRNANGQVAANTAVTTRFTLHQNTADGAVEYQETHTHTTNAQGLMATLMGQGTAVQNTFSAINWSNTTKFLQVEVDLGNGYVDLGTQQLMSVPYAMYAANAPAGPQGPTGPQGPAGADGAVGATGPQGVSVTSITTSGSNFLVTLSDGTTQTVPIPSTGSSGSGSNSNTLIYTITGF
jgi:hypothetical protein